MHNKSIKVLIADRHSWVRVGIRATLSVENDLLLVGEATNVYKAQQLSQEFTPDVLLLDLNTLNFALPETIAYLRDPCPKMKVLVLTTFSDIHIGELVQAGATGCILKDEETETLVRAIRIIAQGDTWFSQAILKKLAQWNTKNLTSHIQETTLTERERQVLDMIAQGWDNLHIASVLCLAEQTVRNYVSRIYAKIAVSSRAEAVVWAIKHCLALENKAKKRY
jgi:DNA-binding NarL/FixJ family response regulator